MPEKEEFQNRIANELFTRRTIGLLGDITNHKIDDLCDHLLELQIESSDPINLIINSFGGSLNPTLMLCDLLEYIITAPVRGIVIGACGSSATFILLHCTERLATPNAKFLIHSGKRMNVNFHINDTTPEALEQLLKEVKKSEENTTNIYLNKLTPTAWKNRQPTVEKKKEFIRSLRKRGDQDFDDLLSAKEAIEVGLIDKIIDKKLNIF